MRKFIIIFVSILFLIAFLLLFVLGEGRFAELLRKGTEESNVALIVNSTPVTEKEIEDHMRRVARDQFEENLSKEEIRELAIERVIRKVVVNNYFKERGITVSEEEIEEELLSRINSHPGVETKEEYFDIMAMQGIDREEVKRRIPVIVKMAKLVRAMMEDIEITEEEALQYYENHKEEAEKEGVAILPFEEIKDTVQKDIAEIYATRMVLSEFDEYRERANIQVLEQL